LNNESMCSEVMAVLRKFQSTFWVSNSALPLDQVCAENQLLTCDIISHKIYQSAILTAIFSFFATLLSFQMVIQSACLHTQARFRRIIDAAAKAEEDESRTSSRTSPQISQRTSVHVAG